MAIIVVVDSGLGNDIKPNVQTAVTAAAATGDIILVPSASRPFIGQITTTKKFKLTCLTIAVVTVNPFSNDYLPEPNRLLWSVAPTAVLFRPESITDASLANQAFFVFNDPAGSPSPTTDTSAIVISDIEFRSKIPSNTAAPTDTPPIPDSEGLSVAEDYALVFNKSLDFQITRCIFKYFGNSAVRYNHWDTTARGLIYKCQFERNAKGKDGLGLGYGVVTYGENLQWVSTPRYGSNNYLFVEDCVFKLHRHSIAGGGCGRHTVRGCYIENNIIALNKSTHAIDGHPRRDASLGQSGYFATHCVESYNNKLINTLYFDGTPVILTGATAAIVSVVTGASGKFRVATNLVQYFAAGRTFTVAGSTGNNGTYTVASSTFTGGNTEITITGTVASGVANGTITFRTHQDLIECAIRIKEGFQVTHNNIVAGYRFGEGVLLENPTLRNPSYPYLYTLGYASGVSGGAGVPNGNDQDGWIYNNDVHIYNGSCENFHNYNPSDIIENREYHLTTYNYNDMNSEGTGTTYTYPHPLRDDLVPVVVTQRRLYRVRTYHTR